MYQVSTDLTTSMFTAHMLTRMRQRKIKMQQVRLALRYGQTLRSNGRIYKVITRKAMKRHSLDTKLSNLTVVMDSKTLDILTVYRNYSGNLKDICNHLSS